MIRIRKTSKKKWKNNQVSWMKEGRREVKLNKLRVTWLVSSDMTRELAR